MTLIAMHNLDEIRNELNAIEKKSQKVEEYVSLIERINKNLNEIKKITKTSAEDYQSLSNAIKEDYKTYSELNPNIQDVLDKYIDITSFLYFSLDETHRTLVDNINDHLKQIKTTAPNQDLSNAIKKDYEEFLGLEENIKNIIRQMIDINKFTEISQASSRAIRPIIKPSIEKINDLSQQIKNSNNPLLKALVEDCERLFETPKGKELTQLLSKYLNEKSTDKKNDIMITIMNKTLEHRHPSCLFRPKYPTSYQNFMIAKFQMEFDVNNAFEKLPRNQKFLIALNELDENALSKVEQLKASTIITKNHLNPTKKDAKPAPNSTPSPSSK